MNLVKKGSTDVTRYVKLQDSSAGTPETGYTITNLDLQYTRNRTAPAAKVDATALAATNSAHGDNQAIEIDSTSSPGLYRVDWPDAAFATGADKVILVVSGSGIDPAMEEIQLVDFDPADGVRLGLTALPNAAADAAGGLPISDAGGLDLDAKIGALTFTVANKVDANATHISGDSGAADNLEAAYDGTGYAHTGNTYPWTAAWDAEVQSEVDDALVAQRLDELLNADSDIDGAAPPTVGSVFHELLTKTTGSFTYDQTTDSLEALRDRGDAAWITATGFSTHTAADVWAAATRTLTAATNITSTGGTTVPQTGDSFARLGAPAGASVSADIAATLAALPRRIKKNTALSGFTFLMVDATDGVTPETGLTVTATRSLDGAAFGACANAVSEISNGVYKIDLAAGDLNGTTVTLKFSATGARTAIIEIVTQD